MAIPATLNEDTIAALDGLGPDDDQYWALLDELLKDTSGHETDLEAPLAAAQTDFSRMLLADLLGRIAEERPQSVPADAARHLASWLRSSQSADALGAELAAVRRLRIAEAKEDVVALMDHLDTEVREQAVQTLAALAENAGSLDSVAREALVRRTRDPEPSVREWATHVLASASDGTRDEDLKRVFRRLLDDPAGDVRCEALRGLARRGSRDALALALLECEVPRELVEIAADAGRDERVHGSLLALAARDWIGDHDLLGLAIEATRPADSERKNQAMVFEVFIDRDGRFRWRMAAGNGRILAESSDSFESRHGVRDALANLEVHFPGAVIAERRSERRVVPSPGGGWDVVNPGSRRRSGHFAHQHEAIARAREIVRNSGGGEVIVHRRDGLIRDSNTVPGKSSRDLRPPRAKAGADRRGPDG